MKDVTSDNFGILIAYLLPGFVALWALRPVVAGTDLLFGSPPGGGPTMGGFLYGTLGAVAAGLIVSAVRWAVIDHLYHRTGIPPPDWDFARLQQHLAAFESHVQDHYRYYQFYANMLVSVALAYGLDRATAGDRGGWWDAAVLAVLVVLVLGSRDALRKYYRRTGALLAPPGSKTGVRTGSRRQGVAHNRLPRARRAW